MTMTATKFMTVEQKQAIANAFRRFAKSGFKRSLFSKALYNYLCGQFGFIAYYDIEGFYSIRFANSAGKLSTIESILHPLFYSPCYEYNDLNSEITKIMLEYQDREAIDSRDKMIKEFEDKVRIYTLLLARAKAATTTREINQILDMRKERAF